MNAALDAARQADASTQPSSVRVLGSRERVLKPGTELK
jgi:hypothetical protein